MKQEYTGRIVAKGEIGRNSVAWKLEEVSDVSSHEVHHYNLYVLGWFVGSHASIGDALRWLVDEYERREGSE